MSVLVCSFTMVRSAIVVVLLFVLIFFVLTVRFFFFFKQKTAYEMRISDWSSDVCSSDLGWAAPRHGHAARRGVGEGASVFSRSRRRGREVAAAIEAGRSEERRVGSVSVRVDLGGRRIIKKKNNKSKRHHTTRIQTETITSTPLNTVDQHSTTHPHN